MTHIRDPVIGQSALMVQDEDITELKRAQMRTDEATKQFQSLFHSRYLDSICLDIF